MCCIISASSSLHLDHTSGNIVESAMKPGAQDNADGPGELHLIVIDN